MSGFNWTCPHCGRDVTIADENFSSDLHTLRIANAVGRHTLMSVFIVCPNRECRKYTLACSLFESHRNGDEKLDQKIRSWNLVPLSNAKIFPPCVPAEVLDDYREACLIKDLSPKASAALSRRCLQRMIRDFWQVTPGRLSEQVEAILPKVDPLVRSAIDAVRQVRDIGAHLEHNAGAIVDSEPKEAELLIGLVETLIREWYVARKQREESLASIQALAETGNHGQKAEQTR
jgi:hypothetical protein